MFDKKPVVEIEVGWLIAAGLVGVVCWALAIYAGFVLWDIYMNPGFK